MNVSTFGRLAFAAVASLALAACGINSVPRAEENAKAKWADVEAQFQRRANLIPNLVEVAQGAAENERSILTEVTEARARATSINVDAADLDDPAKMQEFAAAQGQLGQGIGRLLASFELIRRSSRTRTIWRCRASSKGRRTASLSPSATTMKRCASITPRSAPSPIRSVRTSSTVRNRWCPMRLRPREPKSLLKST